MDRAESRSAFALEGCTVLLQQESVRRDIQELIALKNRPLYTTENYHSIVAEIVRRDEQVSALRSRKALAQVGIEAKNNGRKIYIESQVSIFLKGLKQCNFGNEKRNAELIRRAARHATATENVSSSRAAVVLALRKRSFSDLIRNNLERLLQETQRQSVGINTPAAHDCQVKTVQGCSAECSEDGSPESQSDLFRLSPDETSMDYANFFGEPHETVEDAERYISISHEIVSGESGIAETDRLDIAETGKSYIAKTERVDISETIDCRANGRSSSRWRRDSNSLTEMKAAKGHSLWMDRSPCMEHSDLADHSPCMQTSHSLEHSCDGWDGWGRTSADFVTAKLPPMQTMRTSLSWRAPSVPPASAESDPSVPDEELSSSQNELQMMSVSFDRITNKKEDTNPHEIREIPSNHSSVFGGYFGFLNRWKRTDSKQSRSQTDLTPSARPLLRPVTHD